MNEYISPKSFVEEVKKFNQEMSYLENETCELLIEIIRAITDEIIKNNRVFPHYHSEADRQYAAMVFNQWAMTNLKGMMLAKNQEEFFLYQENFAQTLASLPRTLKNTSLQELNTARCLSAFENALWQIDSMALDNTSQEKQQTLAKIVTQHHFDKLIAAANQAKKIELENLKQELLSINDLRDKQAFIIAREEFLKKIRGNSSYKSADSIHLENLSIIAENNVANLANIRTAYLEKITSHARYLKILGWTLLGVGLVIVGAVIPPLSIAGICLGIASAGYGIIDFAKEATDPLAKKLYPEIGERDKSAFSQKVQQLISPSDSTKNQQLGKNNVTQQITQAKNLRKAVGLTVSAVGSAIGIVGAILLIPGIVFPPAVPIILLSITVAATVIGMGLIARKVFRERRKLNQAKQACEELASSNTEKLKFRENLSNYEDMQKQSNEKIIDDQDKKIVTTANSLSTCALEKKLLDSHNDHSLNTKQMTKSEKIIVLNEASFSHAKPLTDNISPKEIAALNEISIYHHAKLNAEYKVTKNEKLNINNDFLKNQQINEEDEEHEGESTGGPRIK